MIWLNAANEVFDRFATAGFNANMITYLTQQLHMPLVEASNTLTNFAGTSSMTPIIGALIADSFAGRFWTITLGSIFYQLVIIYTINLFFIIKLYQSLLLIPSLSSVYTLIITR